jgi:hypothetical protein
LISRSVHDAGEGKKPPYTFVTRLNSNTFTDSAIKSSKTETAYGSFIYVKAQLPKFEVFFAMKTIDRRKITKKFKTYLNMAQ